MSARVVLVVPGPIGQMTGGYGYDRRMVCGLRARGRQVAVSELAGRFPRADEAARRAARRCLAGLRPGDLPVIDGLALPAFANGLPDRPWVALVHHPLALETGLEPEQAAALRQLEAGLLARATRVVVTSRRTARDVAGLGVPPARIGVAEPGVDHRPLAAAEGSPPRLLAVGALVPRKGYDVLLRAMEQVRDLDWRLVCAGDDRRDPATAAALREMVQALDLAGRVDLAGEVDDLTLDRLYRQADLFVLASRHEGFGMALQEALAYGLPVLSTTAGAIPDTVAADAGLLVPPDDMEALAAALRRWLTAAGLRRQLRTGARRARGDLRDWTQAAARFAEQLEHVRV